MGSAGTGDGAPIPSPIADKLRGREFGSFDSFRKAFWKATSELNSQFKKQNKTNIKNSLSPFVPESEPVGGRQRFELHHVKPISEGGAVYDVDSIRVTTPKRHIEIHKGNK
ncbi:HNH endonuclease signature motif containing protein [Salmonella enterica]